MSKILITGVNGQVGRETFNLLKSAINPEKHDGITEVWASDLLEVPGADKQITIDLADSNQIKQAVRKIEPDIIISCGAYTQVDKAEDNVEAAKLINGIAPGVFATEAARLDSLLIHFSTDYVLGGLGSNPADERKPTVPVNVYGSTKLEGEMNIKKVNGKHIILRTSWVFSAFGNNFVKTMLKIAETRKELAVVDDQIGSPTSARELAKAVQHIIHRQDSPPKSNNIQPFGIFNCTCSGETSWHGFAEEIFSQASKLDLSLNIPRILKVPTAEYPTRAVRPLNSRLDNSLFGKTFRHELSSWQSALSEVMLEISVKTPEKLSLDVAV